MGRRKKTETVETVVIPNDGRNHAIIIPITVHNVDGNKTGWGCSKCHTMWNEKDEYDECPLCSCVFDAVAEDKEPYHLYSKKYREKMVADERAARVEARRIKKAEAIAKAGGSKRGRKKKTEVVVTTESPKVEEPAIEQPKRKRGRPKKNA